LDKFWRALDWKMLIYFMAICNTMYFTDIWYIVCPFGTFCVHLVHFVSICHICHICHICFLFWYIVSKKIWQHRLSVSLSLSKLVPTVKKLDRSRWIGWDIRGRVTR
jgi:hypothetical protein